MRRIWVIIGMVAVLGVFMVWGCAVEKHTYHGSAYYNPNWFPDGKVVYLENYDRYRIERYFPAGDDEITLEDSWYVCEMNADGSEKKRIVKLPFEWDLGGSHPCVSATNDKIVLGNGSDGIWVLNRDGSGLKKIVEGGCYPDFNPEGTKVVYEKPKEGIWIYDLTTGKDSCIISDTLAMMPAWSPDGEKIAYGYGDTWIKEIWIYNFSNSSIYKLDSVSNWGGIHWWPDVDTIMLSPVPISPDGIYKIYATLRGIKLCIISTGECKVILKTYTEEE